MALLILILIHINANLFAQFPQVLVELPACLSVKVLNAKKELPAKSEINYNHTISLSGKTENIYSENPSAVEVMCADNIQLGVAIITQPGTTDYENEIDNSGNLLTAGSADKESGVFLPFCDNIMPVSTARSGQRHQRALIVLPPGEFEEIIFHYN